ncbi:MAG: ATP-binding protein [Candidatus Peribacteraceae bacterium]|nr:ATP-binding protein [Candidatus Peribacteraceae bacterium]
MKDRLEMTMNIGGYSAEECASMAFVTLKERENMEVSLPLKKDVAHAVDIFHALTDKIGDPKQALSRLMVLEEAFVNMLLHGNKGNPELLSMARMVIEIHRDDTHRRVSYIVSLDDHAPTFDLSTVPDPTDEENLEKPNGRGLVYIQDLGGATIQQIPHPGGKTMVYAWKEEFSTLPEQATEQDEI